MKKLLSIVLVLAMLASLAVTLPFGASAADAGTTIYSANFNSLNGSYTPAEFAAEMGWELVRSNEVATAEAATVSVANGKVTFTSAASTDLVFKMASDARLLDNFTAQYTMQQTGKSAQTNFAGIYTGKTADTHLVAPKVSYEGYGYVAFANGTTINETKHNGFQYDGTATQARPEHIKYGGGFSQYSTETVFKYVADFDTKQVDFFASNMLVTSTRADESWNSDAAGMMAATMGQNAYLRVQKGITVIFDDISFVTGGSVAFDTDGTFLDLTFDNAAGTDQSLSLAQVTEMFGWDWTTNDSSTSFLLTANGKLRMTQTGTTVFNAWLKIPEMDMCDRYVVEWEQTLLRGNTENVFEAWGTDIFGIRSDRHVYVNPKANGYMNVAACYDSTVLYWPTSSQLFADDAPYNKIEDGSAWQSITSSDSCIYDSTDKYQVVLDKNEGVSLIINGEVVFFGDVALSSAETFDHIMGYLMHWTLGANGNNSDTTVELDNLKIHTGEINNEKPALLITEVAAGGSAGANGNYEYIKIYNNSTSPINIYNYYLVNTTEEQAALAYSAKRNTENASKTIPEGDIMTFYPGAHTYNVAGQTFTKGDVTVNLYATLHNPAYEEGVLQPGETAYLWSATNCAWGGQTWHDIVDGELVNTYEQVRTVEGFRATVGASEDVKVFRMHNDSGRSMNNGGNALYALAKLTDFVNGSATNHQSNTVKSGIKAIDAHKLFVSYVCYSMETIASSWSTNYPLRTVLMGSDNFAQYIYPCNNSSRAGFIYGASNVADYSYTLGANDYQKRTFKATVNGKAATLYLGDNDLAGFENGFLYATVDGTLTSDRICNVLADGKVITTMGAEMKTLNGASIRLASAATSGLRWETAISLADYNALIADSNADVTNVEIGTIIIHTEDMGATLTLDDVTSGAARKVVAKGFFDEATDAANPTFSASVVNILEKNLAKSFSAVGYITVTLSNGDTVTLYSDVIVTRSVAEVADNLIAANDGADYAALSDDHKEIVDKFAVANDVVA